MILPILFIAYLIGLFIIVSPLLLLFQGTRQLVIDFYKFVLGVMLFILVAGVLITGFLLLVLI